MRPSLFGTLLRRYRMEAGFTQEELAERAGLSVRGISDLERGARTRPHRATVALLADALPITPDQRDLLTAASRWTQVSLRLRSGGEDLGVVTGERTG